MDDFVYSDVTLNDNDSSLDENNQESSPIILMKVDKNYFIFVSLYGSIFFIGLIGNLWALKLILSIFYGRRCSMIKCRRRKIRRQISKRDTVGGSTSNSQTINNTLLLYTLVLCITDLVIVSIIPLLIVDYFADTWLFGKILCKSFWIIENGHKIASKLILMAMSVDRFVVIFRPININYSKRLRTTLIILSCIFLFILCSLLPINAYTELIEAKLINGNFNFALQDNNESHYDEESSSTPNFTSIVKCIVPMPGPFLENYTLYLFIIGFCVPTLIITCCYASILAKIFLHRQRLLSSFGGGGRHSQLPTVRVTVMIITLVLLYLVCWTPYWTMTLYIMKRGNNNNNDDGQNVFVYSALMVSHVLVYANSAVNWVPCVLMNRSLRALMTRQRRKMATNNTPIIVGVVDQSAIECRALIRLKSLKRSTTAKIQKRATTNNVCEKLDLVQKIHRSHSARQ